MRRSFLHLLPILLLAAIPREAAACFNCGYAAIEEFFPPTIPWSIIGILGFLILGVRYPPPTNTRIGAFFKKRNLAIVAACAMGSTLVLGPPLLLLLVPLVIVGAGLSWRANRTRELGVFAGLLVLSLVITGAISTMEWRLRDDVAIVARWPMTNTSEWKIERMATAKDIAGLRGIVQGDSGFDSAHAAKKLARIGVTKVDAPLMIASLRKREGTSWESHNCRELDRALERLLGGVPTTGRTAADWEAYFLSLP